MAKSHKPTKARQAAISAYQSQRKRIKGWERRNRRKGILLQDVSLPKTSELKNLSTQKIKSLTANLKTLTPGKLLKRSVYVDRSTGEIENASQRKYRKDIERIRANQTKQREQRRLKQLKTAKTNTKKNIAPKKKLTAQNSERVQGLEQALAYVNRARTWSEAHQDRLDNVEGLINEAYKEGNLDPDLDEADLTVVAYGSDPDEVSAAMSRLVTALTGKTISATESENLNG